MFSGRISVEYVGNGFAEVGRALDGVDGTGCRRLVSGLQYAELAWSARGRVQVPINLQTWGIRKSTRSMRSWAVVNC